MGLHKGPGELVVPAVVVLVGLTAFGLGRLSAGEGPRLVVYDTPAGQAAAAVLGKGSVNMSSERAEPPGAGKYVASANGTKYYLPSCSGVSRIKEENKIWFESAEEAEAAGYAPAANCPGL